MPVQLHPGFDAYLNTLALKPTTRANYKQYVRWIERYASEPIDLVLLRDAGKVENFMVQVGKAFDANSTAVRKHKFYPYRRTETLTILRHYRHFLEAESIVSDQAAELERAGEFDPRNEREGKEKVLRSIALRRGQQRFRAALLAAYDNKCALTGTAVESVLEAAHIKPYNGRSTNHVTNGLLLRSDVHALFDLGLLSIAPDTLTIYCSEQVRTEPLYANLHGNTMRTPKEASIHPNKEALRNHFEQRTP